jgi:hypothetical protein
MMMNNVSAPEYVHLVAQAMIPIPDKVSNQEEHDPEHPIGRDLQQGVILIYIIVEREEAASDKEVKEALRDTDGYVGD